MSYARPAAPYGASSSGLTSRPNAHNAEVQVQMPRDFDMEDEVDGLRSKVKLLKRMSHEIGEEASIRGQLIDALEIDFSSSDAAMRDIKEKLNKAYKQAKSGHLMALMFFALSAFAGLFIFMKFTAVVRFFVPKGQGHSVRHH